MKYTFLNESKLNVLFVFLLVFLSACSAVEPVAQTVGGQLADGQITSIMPGTVHWVIKQAYQGSSSSVILNKDNLYLFMRVAQQGWNFVSINAQDQRAITSLRDMQMTGNFANAKTTTDLLDCLTRNGWKVITSAEVDRNIIQAVLSGASWVSNALTTFIIIPGGIIEECPGCGEKL